jgi:LysM repeat protein
MNDKDITDYATRDQVNKIETHLFQLEERLVWTDEKIDTMQAVAEAAAMQALEDKKNIEINSTIEKEFEQMKPEASVLTDLSVEKPLTEATEIITRKKPEAPPKEVPVLQPKIKKKKIKRREFGIIYKYHKVRQGETLYRIGLKYNVPVSEIRRLNHLDSDQSIHPGQRLLVSQGKR